MGLLSRRFPPKFADVGLLVNDRKKKKHDMKLSKNCIPVLG